MSGRSSIEWTDATWNPVRGCSRVSEGCRNCYAERLAARFGWLAGGYPAAHSTPEGPRWSGKVALVPDALDWPLRRRKPLRIFVNSMSDLFHESLSDPAIAAVFGVMLLAEQHTFQVLTKRPERAREWFRWVASNPVWLGELGEKAQRFDVGPAASCLALLGGQVSQAQARGPLFTAAVCGAIEPAPDAPIRSRWPLPNVWLGVSVEDQATADERIPVLLQTPAAHRFISAEPLLGPIQITRLAGTGHDLGWCRRVDGLEWVIVGGESGPSARPCDLRWVRSIVTECCAASVPCFVKQLGAQPNALGFLGAGRFMGRLLDRKGGDPAEWPESLRVRQVPA
jgi:protein gp37